MRKIEVDGANLSFSIFFHSSSVQSGNNLILFDITSFGQKKRKMYFFSNQQKIFYGFRFKGQALNKNRSHGHLEKSQSQTREIIVGVKFKMNLEIFILYL